MKVNKLYQFLLYFKPNIPNAPYKTLPLKFLEGYIILFVQKLYICLKSKIWGNVFEIKCEKS